MNLSSLHALFVDELQDIYDAEQQIAEALPQMADAAANPDLKQAFESHLAETADQIDRLDRVFEIIGVMPSGIECAAARGLIEESDDVIESLGEPAVKDAALIGAAQRVEHYEMASYGTACALAKQLNLEEAANLLHRNLEEEEAADKKLTRLAVGSFFTAGINEEAKLQTPL